MATGKRASMREGPLADLFRKTAAGDLGDVCGQAAGQPRALRASAA